MKFSVHMLAFYAENDKIRIVDVPDEEFDNIISSATINEPESTDDILELVYRYGQNDFQPQQIYSVSVGDVIQLDRSTQLFLVVPMGFQEITLDQLSEIKKMDATERSTHGYVRQWGVAKAPSKVEELTHDN